MQTTTTDPTSTLKETWRAHRESNPQVRIRDAAATIGVSEAELLATRCGENVTRIAKPEDPLGWGKIITQLPSLGRVMALTRNEHCVHERKGEYRQIDFHGPVCTVLGHDIDLRIFLNRWHSGFAVRDEGKDGPQESLQFFDRDGGAVHKIYLQPESNRDAFDAIVREFKSADQSADQKTEAIPAPAPDRPDADIDTEGFRAGWRGLQDTHNFYMLLRKFGVGRVQALRLIGEEFAYSLTPLCAEPLLRAAAEDALPIMVFTGSPGVIQIHTGPVQRIVPFGRDGEWINVLDPDFNLHLRQTAIAHAWVTKKPTRDGTVTSVELFDAQGEMVVQFFGKRKPGEPELEGWRQLVSELRRTSP